MTTQDTIAAISTPLGKSGIGIVRLSGPRSIEIASKIFRSTREIDLSKVNSHTLHYGFIEDDKERTIDEVLLTIMHKPQTYTRENLVEINCHGGIVPLREILELTLDKGARPAEPGEFTKRAFLNGRISLDQAKSINEIVESKTRLSLELAVNRLEGKFSKFVVQMRNNLTDLAAKIEVAIDFPQYEQSLLDLNQMRAELTEAIKEIEKVLQTSKDGKILREGHRIAVLGRPNTGKSTLLNTLLKQERAIVTEVPGTTRDSIEEQIEINGIPFVITDTAGIRNPSNEIEREGIDRATREGERADLVLFLVDVSSSIMEEDKKIARILDKSKTILLLNKCDLEHNLSKKECRDKLGRDWARTLHISAKQGTGIEDLEQTVTELIWGGKIDKTDDFFLLNVREKQLLKEALDEINQARDALDEGRTVDLVEMDLRAARISLGKLTGEDATEEVIDRIFSNFCVGK